MEGRPAQNHPRLPWPTIADYSTAYARGDTTPEVVAQRVLEAIAESQRRQPPLNAFIASYREDAVFQARQALQRHAEGRTLGPLDGVPIAVKDELDMMPYPTTVGTSFLGNAPAQLDATVVSRLRRAGALLMGKTNMHEIGILPFGVNPHFGTVRNPYHPGHDSGGSSSGSAAAVAAGICPAAIGADGGGSIRIPAAFCGVVGLKPTYGRVSETGAAPLCWSVAHVGPIGATVEDVAQLYAVIAGPDPSDPNTLNQPQVTMGVKMDDARGVQIGIFRDWFADCDPEVLGACESAVERLVAEGAQKVAVVVPDLHLASVAFGFTILSEMAASMSSHRGHHRDLGRTTRLMLALIGSQQPNDYVQAQRVRTGVMRSFLSALRQVDAIATPTAAITAPAVVEKAQPHGESDVALATQAMRYTSVANFTGLPAISVPVGYDSRGLPVGLQLLGKPWDEGRLLSIARLLEASSERRQPRIHYDVLPERRDAQVG